MRWIKTILFSLLCNISISQDKYDHNFQVWAKAQLDYKAESILLTNQLEHRYDYTENSNYNQYRLQIATDYENVLNYGGGVTIRNNEFRLHQMFKYDMHRFIIEERFFNSFTLLRFRYLLYPEIKIDKYNKFNIGIETMLQGLAGKKFTSSETRIMIDFSQTNTDNSIIKIGYMASIFKANIIHSIRVSGNLRYFKK